MPSHIFVHKISPIPLNQYTWPHVACLFSGLLYVEWALPGDPQGGDGGVRHPHVPQVPTAGQVKGWSRLPVVEAGFPSTLHSCPHVGAFVFFFIFLFFLEHRFPSFSMEGKMKRIICSNNHFSVTAGKVAFQPIFIGLLERQTMVLN